VEVGTTTTFVSDLMIAIVAGFAFVRAKDTPALLNNGNDSDQLADCA
jgi:hypothetical protein